jgi:methyltransferase
MITGWTQLDPLAVIVLALVTAQRLAELVYARSNEARLRSAGGIERGAAHYPMIVVMHTAWLIGLWLLAASTPPHLGWLAVFVVLQILRVWVLATLGRRWTTRIIVLPGKAPIRSGPYRYFPHPNYAIVAAEILVLPLAFGLVAYALVFSALNAGVLAIRIREENAALHEIGASAVG